MADARTIYFAGGGTGGHLFPGLAVAREWQRRFPADRLIFVGSERALEKQIVQSAGYELRSLPAVSLAQVWRRPLRFLGGNWKALRLAREWLRKESAGGVVGLGGYASAPLVLAARRMKIPVVLLEQNVIPGKTNRWLARRAENVCCAFEETRGHFANDEKAVWTGNPVRAEIAALHARSEEPREEGRRRLLISGGSLGAVAVNRLSLAAMREINELRNWEIVHQTGAQDFEFVRDQYREMGIRAEVQPFFDRMADWYAGTTLCVARAGGTTLAELGCAGIPAVLVPYPEAADDHQVHNADYYARQGAAEIVPQMKEGALNQGEFCEVLRTLIASRERVVEMRERMFGVGMPEATERVVEVLERVFCAGR